MNLAASVLDYYFTHASRLSNQKRFHLANRIASWNGDPRAKQLLADRRSWFVAEPTTEKSLNDEFERTAQHAEHTAGHIVGYPLRKPYFDKFPALLGIEAELFRVRHLRTVYGIDATRVFLQRHPLLALQQLEQDLLADPGALRTLSTWAINFVYLLHRVVLNEDKGIDVVRFHELGNGYNLQDEEQLRLFIYLYTHCIIAESNFYARPIPEQYRTVYQGMALDLEKLLKNRLQQTSLDTKLEFLVCCRLLDYQTGLFGQIFDECAASVSPEGTFIVDTHNIFASNAAKKTFEASEHRNVLFALSALPRLER